LRIGYVRKPVSSPAFAGPCFSVRCAKQPFLALPTNGCLASFVEQVFCPKTGGHFWENLLRRRSAPQYGDMDSRHSLAGSSSQR
jgi:hypothetical protein